MGADSAAAPPGKGEPVGPAATDAAMEQRSEQAAVEEAEKDRRDRTQAEAATVVDRSLRAALAALRDGDLTVAARSVDAAAEAAGEDSDLSSRCDRWRLLVAYAGDLEAHRRRASESAAKGREYVIGDRTIGIVELTPQAFVYKEAGRLVRGPRRDLPKPIERAILRDWFAADGRVANHIFLGVDRLLDREPDLERVRADWETALRGEPATKPLLPLLDDPAVTGS